METYLIIIKGRVQGVFFRDHTYNEARNLGLKGYVRNLVSGDVEIAVQGEKEQLSIFIDWCNKGSPAAKVENIDIQKKDLKEFLDFVVR